MLNTKDALNRMKQERSYKMLDKLVVFNFFGNGDIFESREFVRDLMKIFPAKGYHYLTGKSKRLLMDIPELVVSNDFPSFITTHLPWILKDNCLYFNTWIGQNSKYVLPGIGCTVEMLHRMYSDLLLDIGRYHRELSPARILSLSSSNPLDYLTDFDYSKFNVESEVIQYFIENYTRYRTSIFISNGNVQSCQAENFDMTELINKLASTFSDIIFYVTQAMDTSNTNIIDANKFTEQGLDSNLVELSYLSTKCKFIIGRNSGPQVFSWTKKNCFSNKVNITLTYNQNCSHFVHHLPITMKRYWSNETNTDKLFDFISDIFNKEM